MKRITSKANRDFTDAFYIGALCWFVSMPLLIFHFNQINPWAVVCGIILVPFVFASLIGGFAKIVLTLMWPSLAGTWALFASMPIACMRHVLSWLARLPHADVPMPSMPIWGLLLIYALFLAALLPTPRPKLRILFRLCPVAAVVLAILLPFHRVESAIAPEELKLTLLSLGAGQCAIVDLPSGRTLVIDAGSSSMADVLGKCIGPFMHATQHTEIDSMYLTHCDYDHISAAGALAQMYDIREVMIGPQFRSHSRGNYPAETLLRTLDGLDHPPRVMEPGQHIPLGRGAELEILWPGSKSGELSSNDSALVGQLRYAGRSILITGDIQEAGEKGLLQTPDALKADVLIAPHHGSSELTTGDFVRAVKPTYVLSSNDRSLTGKQRRFEKLIGDAQLFRTNRCGAITVHISKDGTIRVETFLKTPD